MATRLDNLKLTSVSLVDRGANQSAKVELFKRATAKECEPDMNVNKEADKKVNANKKVEPKVNEVNENPVVKVNVNKGAMTPEDRAAYDALVKKYGLSDTDVSAQTAQIDALKTVVDNLTKRIESQAKAAQDAAMLEVAKKYAPLGQDPATLAKTLSVLPDDARKSMLDTLDTALKAQSSLFTEIGKRGGTNEGGAWSAIEKHAAELRKNNPAMSHEDSIVAACDANPDLVAQYEGER